MKPCLDGAGGASRPRGPFHGAQGLPCPPKASRTPIPPRAPLTGDRAADSFHHGTADYASFHYSPVPRSSFRHTTCDRPSLMKPDLPSLPVFRDSDDRPRAHGNPGRRGSVRRRSLADTPSQQPGRHGPRYQRELDSSLGTDPRITGIGSCPPSFAKYKVKPVHFRIQALLLTAPPCAANRPAGREWPPA